MIPNLESHLDVLNQWRLDTAAQLTQLARFLREHALLDDNGADWFQGISHRLSSEKLMVAFVAEFSRGKSELINAIFLSDKGRRLMPASVGRTTMCPVELAYDAERPDGLSLLPIETRLMPRSLADLCQSPQDWTFVALDLSQPECVADALAQVMQTRHVSVDQATQLGFWSPERMEDNPPLDHEGLVEVPLWRHARINLPHPLLKLGLVVLDTPGLNAVGVELELTLGMLPHAHAIVFLLGADTGVTRSDLNIWRDHLNGPADSRFVVLNKIDTLADPLSTPQQIQDTIESQRLSVAQTLTLPSEKVFPLSARQALTARLHSNVNELVESRLPAFEQALSEGLLPQRWKILSQSTIDGVGQLQQQINQRFDDLLRQYTEQDQELRSLRGKSSGKIQLLLQRIQAEATEFEQCKSRLAAMRNVHARMLKQSISQISSERLQQEVDSFIQALSASWLPFGALKSFENLCVTLQNLLTQVQADNQEIHAMLFASFERLNADFGFSLAAPPPLDLQNHMDEIKLIEKDYAHYLSLRQAMSFTQTRLHDRLRRMLVSRLRVVFDATTHHIEAWSRVAASQVDTQLRERRRNFKLRYESLLQIQSVSSHLDVRLNELQSQQLHAQQLKHQLNAQVERIVCQAGTMPSSKETLPAPNAIANTALTEHFFLDFKQLDATEL